MPTVAKVGTKTVMQLWPFQTPNITAWIHTKTKHLTMPTIAKVGTKTVMQLWPFKTLISLPGTHTKTYTPDHAKKGQKWAPNSRHESPCLGPTLKPIHLTMPKKAKVGTKFQTRISLPWTNTKTYTPDHAKKRQRWAPNSRHESPFLGPTLKPIHLTMPKRSKGGHQIPDTNLPALDQH